VSLDPHLGATARLAYRLPLHGVSVITRKETAVSNRTPQQQGSSDEREFLSEDVGDEFDDLLTRSEKVDGR